MHCNFACRNRSRTFMKRYGASSLSHSTSVGNPRRRLLAISASCSLYAASTASGGVSALGRSFSVTVMLIGARSQESGNRNQEERRPEVGGPLTPDSCRLTPELNFDLDRE